LQSAAAFIGLNRPFCIDTLPKSAGLCLYFRPPHVGSQARLVEPLLPLLAPGRAQITRMMLYMAAEPNGTGRMDRVEALLDKMADRLEKVATMG
jgi:hypothetical protein